MYKYVLNSVVKISLMFKYYAIILRGGAFFRGHAVHMTCNDVLSYLMVEIVHTMLYCHNLTHNSGTAQKQDSLAQCANTLSV